MSLSTAEATRSSLIGANANYQLARPHPDSRDRTPLVPHHSLCFYPVFINSVVSLCFSVEMRSPKKMSQKLIKWIIAVEATMVNRHCVLNATIKKTNNRPINASFSWPIFCTFLDNY
jgi:hypothetical protein